VFFLSERSLNFLAAIEPLEISSRAACQWQCFGNGRHRDLCVLALQIASTSPQRVADSELIRAGSYNDDDGW
jgi:hypothetical protein